MIICNDLYISIILKVNFLSKKKELKYLNIFQLSLIKENFNFLPDYSGNLV